MDFIYWYLSLALLVTECFAQSSLVSFENIVFYPIEMMRVKCCQTGKSVMGIPMVTQVGFFFSELTNALPVIKFCLCSNLKVQDHEETVSGM